MASTDTRFGVRIGVLDLAPGTSWADVASDDCYDPATRAALPAGLRLVSFDLINEHATDTVYVQLKAAAAEAATNALRVGPRSYLDDFDVEGAAVVTTLSHQGSGATGSAQFVGRWRPA